MLIRRIDYGLFPQVNMLNHRFRPDVPHLKVTMDVNCSTVGHDAFIQAYRRLVGLMPTLAHHACCEQWENTPLFLEKVEDVSLKLVGEIADVAHLIEHVIVDLQVAITGMTVCSGVTCGHREPENRFDLFIECIDPRMGAFAVHFAVDLVSRALRKSRLSARHRGIIDVAREITLYPELLGRCNEIAQRLRMQPAAAQLALNRIAQWTQDKPDQSHQAA